MSCFSYLLVKLEYSDEQIYFEDDNVFLLKIEDKYEDQFEKIDHIISNIYLRLFPNWRLVAWGNDINPHMDYNHFDFLDFFLPEEFLYMRQDEFSGFNELFYELDDNLLQDIINYFHSQFVMEDFDDESIAAYNFIIKNGPLSKRKNIKYKGK